ncbi:MAG: Hsp20/alpha crystallin family protein [Cyclobacteriaceae bacterium]
MEKFLGSRIDDHTDEAEVIATVPSVNIADKNKAFEVSVALPGMEKKDVQIEVEGDCLVISSQKQFTKEEGEGRWMRREYGYASFQRIFQLPSNADPEQIEAKMKHGVLKIKIGKIKDRTVQTISVQ